MAVTLPDDAVEQLDQGTGLDSAGNKSSTRSWKGEYSGLATAMAAVKSGDEFEAGGDIIQTWNLRRAPGGLGVLTISLLPASETDGEGNQEALKETWSLKSCRNDVSILAYCGTGENNPNRIWIECWQKESDEKIAATGNFINPDGTTSNLSIEKHCAATSDLMAKIEQGVESVMRFYPQLTCRRIYSKPPNNVMRNLGYIDLPATPGTNAIMPGNLTDIVEAHQWLKIQDDCDEAQDGSWTRVESWIGILRPENDDEASPWDPDLYGPARWPMPYNHAGSSGESSGETSGESSGT